MKGGMRPKSKAQEAVVMAVAAGGGCRWQVRMKRRKGGKEVEG